MQSVPTRDQVVAAFQQMRIPDTIKVREAESFLKLFLGSVDSLPILIDILTSEPDDCNRQMSALFLRKVVMERWGELNDNLKEQFKETILVSLRREKIDLVRKAICGVVSTIAHIEIDNGQKWPQIVTLIKNYAVSDDPSDREISQLVLYALYNNIDTFMDLSEICILLLNGLQDPVSPAVRNMAFKAATSIIEIGSEMEYLDELKPILHPYFTILQNLLNEQDVFLCTRAFASLSCVANSPSTFFDSLLTDIINLCLQVVTCREVEDSIRTSICEFLTSVLTTRASLIVNLNLHRQIIETAINCLSDGADSEGEDEDDLVCSYMESVLDVASKEMSTKLVFQIVCEIAVPLLSNQNWEARRAGIVALMVISESCIDEFAVDINNICTHIRPLLFDSNKAVMKKTSYFFSEVVEYMGKVLLSNFPPIIDDFMTLLNQNNEFSQNCGLYILECLGQYIDSIDYEKLLATLVPRLFTIFNQCTSVVMKTLIISCITSLVISVEAGFQPYARTAGELCVVLMQYEDPALQSLRGRATELMTSLICYTDNSYIQDLMDQTLTIINKSLSNPALIDEYVFHFYGSLSYQHASQLEPLFEQVIQFIITFLKDESEIDHITKSGADQEFGQISGDLAVEGDDSLEAAAFITVIPEVANVKCAAISTINRFTNSCPQLIVKYHQELMKILLAFTQHMSDKIKEKAYDCLCSCIQTIYQLEGIMDFESIYPPNYRLPQTTGVYLNLINQVALQAIEEEQSTEVVCQAIDLLDSCIASMGPAVIGERLNDYWNDINLLLTKKTSCQNYVDCDSSEYASLWDNEDDTVTCEGMKLLTTIIENCGVCNQVQSVLVDLWNIVKVYLNKDKDELYIEHAIQVGCTILDIFKNAEFVVSDLLNMVPYSMESENENLQSNMAYFIGLLYANYPQKFTSNANDFIQVLTQFMDDKSIKDTGSAHDNAISAIIYIYEAYPDTYSRTIIPAVISHLPLISDHQEDEHVYNFIFKLLNENNTLAYQQLNDVISIFINYINDENQTETISNTMNTYLRSFASRPDFQAVVSTLSVEDQQSLQQLLI
ncbi:hypothetical protein WA158_005681 [Blastocystis sp. Blastoise]